MSPFYPNPVQNDVVLSPMLKTAKIMGGFVAEPYEFPYQVNLRYHDDLLCGGSIINALFILTAAHCVKYKLVSKLSIVAGDHDHLHVEGTEQARNVSYIFMHQEYQWETDVNDIAILALSSPLQFNRYVQSIPWPKYPTNFSGMGLVTGWGKTGETSPANNVLQKLRVPIVPREECQRSYGRVKLNITKDMLCAGDIGKDSCRGDSGSALTCKLPETGENVICGIVSHGIGCGRKGFPGVYTDVSQFGAWIEKTMNQFILKGKCKMNRFYCPEDNKCISRSLLCNAINDCSQGSDEQNCKEFVATPQNFFRCSNGYSIRANFLCDSMDDCWDNSDEEKCEKIPCMENQFQCKSEARCIPKAFICDETVDCQDASDEVCENELQDLRSRINATTSTTTAPDLDTNSTTLSSNGECPKAFFRCPPKNRIRGICIPERWKCDGEKDCFNGQDEENCDKNVTTSASTTTESPTSTTTTQAPCTSTQVLCHKSEPSTCIPKSLQCDGDDDCEMGEDEENCLAIGVTHLNGKPNPSKVNATRITTMIMQPKICSSNEFKCNSGECILKAFRCDFEVDCKDKSDEENCDKKPQCSTYQWKCANGDCIYHKFRCDKDADCSDSSDEIGCPQEEEIFKGKNCTDRQFRCLKGNCIPKVFQCDSDEDCELGEDELGCPDNTRFNGLNDLL